MGFWWPLEDCDVTNGCLWAVPGSHSRGVTRRFKRGDATKGEAPTVSAAPRVTCGGGTLRGARGADSDSRHMVCGAHDVARHAPPPPSPRHRYLQVFDPVEPVAFDTAGGVPLLTPAGSLVLLHSALLHWSDANTSVRSRFAYSIHVVEGGEGVVYPADNWL